MSRVGLIDSLEGFRRRVRLLSIVLGLAVVVAAAVALLLTTVGLDYLLNLPPIPRVMVMFIAVTALGYVLHTLVVRPILAKLKLSDVAARLETAFPQFQDRLRSTVNFMQSPTPGSDAMKGKVIGQAEEMAASVNFGKALATGPVWASLGAAVTSMVIAIGIAMLVGAGYRRIILSRLVTPLTGMPWPRSVQIQMVGNVPTRVPVGQRVDIKMHLTRGDRASMKASVFYQYGDGPVMQEYMTRGEAGQYSAAIDARSDGKSAGALKVWMKAGDDQMSLAPITVVQRLALTSVVASVEAPPYTKLKPMTIDLGSRPATMVEGSAVSITATFNKPLRDGQSIRLEPIGAAGTTGGASAAPASPTLASAAPASAGTASAGSIAWNVAGSSAVGRWMPEKSLRFHIRAQDADGFENNALEEYELVVRPDQMPAVLIEDPQHNEECTPVAVVPLQAAVEDDFGIDTVSLMIDRAGSNARHWELPLVKDGVGASGVSFASLDSTSAVRRFRLNYAWDLAALDTAGLKPGDILQFTLQVRDTFDLNGRRHDPVNSGRLQITIISQEQFTQLVADSMRNLATQVNDLHNAQEQTRLETDNLRKDVAGKPQLNEGDRAVASRLTNQQSAAAAQTKQVAGKLDDLLARIDQNKSPASDLKDAAAQARQILSTAAENPMKSAAARLGQARDATTQPSSTPAQQQQEAQNRDQNLNQATADQAQASAQLSQALERLGNVGGLDQLIDRLAADLKAQQDVGNQTRQIGQNNLGRKPEQMPQRDQQDLARNAQDQNALSQQTSKDLADLDKSAQNAQQSDPESAQSMQQASQAAQQNNVSADMQRASDEISQNQQSSAQNDQQQAELGLQVVINKLRDAEQRRLEALSQKLENLAAQIDELISQQAGHNLDDLHLQGAAAVAHADPKLIADLLADAGRVQGAEPATPDLPQLTALQEQTERNARDVGKTTGDLPQGAEPAARLVRAAEKMQRAIVALRANKLGDALDPSMNDALAALKEAATAVEQQRNTANQNRQNRQRETIRQSFVKIRDLQAALNGTTAALDKAAAGGNAVSHADQIRLNRLPGDQGDLADQADKLNTDLDSMGSIVYIWANKDIVKSMREVKDLLGKPETGTITQAEQARVVDQLTAMINDLAVRPQQQRFNQPRQGGGGGQGGAGGGQQANRPPPLPPEAELHLLRQLQVAVNDNTKKLDTDAKVGPDAANADQPKLLSLGGRQGELRGLLDQLLQKASDGKVKLGPEPKDEVKLPEEASDQAIDDQELENRLLNADPTADDEKNDLDLIGSRMSRSRVRLANDKDPGTVTQKIQDRIVMNLDALIKMAQQQQQQQQQQQRQRQPGQGQPQPRPGEQGQPQNQANGQQGQPEPNNGANPAQASRIPGAPDGSNNPTGLIEDRLAEWGKTTPRDRQAVIEGAGEQPIDKFKAFIDDYYKSLATKATER